MKKIFVMMMAILMVFCMVACGDSVEGTNTDTETTKTATFIINNIDVTDTHNAPAKIFIGLYCESLDKELFVDRELLSDYSDFYCRYTEGDYVKVTWEEDKTGKAIESSLIFEKVSNELVPIKDVGEP